MAIRNGQGDGWRKFILMLSFTALQFSVCVFFSPASAQATAVSADHTSQNTGQKAVPPGVVARVGNRFISDTVYAQELGRALQRAGIADLALLSQAEQKIIRAQVMENLVNGLLLRLLAENRFEISAAEIDHEIARGRRAFGDGDRYLQWLTQNHLDEDSLRDEVRGRLAVARLRQAIAAEITLTDSELQTACDKARREGKLYRTEETVDFQVIALAFPEGDTQAQEKTEQLAKEILSKIDAGEDFSALVRQWTNDIPAIERDGWSWETPLSSLPVPVADALKTLEAGSVSPPITVPGSVFILHLEKRHTPGEISCNDALPAVQYKLKQIKINEKVSEMVKSAALTMHVELFPAIADSIKPIPIEATQTDKNKW